MPSGAAANRLMLLAAVVMAALLIVGFVVGAVGPRCLGEGSLSWTNRRFTFLLNRYFPFPPSPRVWVFADVEHDGGDTKEETQAAGDHPPAAEAAEHGEGDAAEEHHFSPLGATEFAITNTLLSAWIASIAIILFFVLGARRRSMVPAGSRGWWRA